MPCNQFVPMISFGGCLLCSHASKLTNLGGKAPRINISEFLDCPTKSCTTLSRRPESWCFEPIGQLLFSNEVVCAFQTAKPPSMGGAACVMRMLDQQDIRSSQTPKVINVGLSIRESFNWHAAVRSSYQSKRFSCCQIVGSPI